MSILNDLTVDIYLHTNDGDVEHEPITSIILGNFDTYKEYKDHLIKSIGKDVFGSGAYLIAEDEVQKTFLDENLHLKPEVFLLHGIKNDNVTLEVYLAWNKVSHCDVEGDVTYLNECQFYDFGGDYRELGKTVAEENFSEATLEALYNCIDFVQYGNSLDFTESDGVFFRVV